MSNLFVTFITELIKIIMKKLEIKLTEYDWTCADGCCSEFGTITNINGDILPCHNTDTDTILKQILEYLGYDVTIETNYQN